MTDSESRVWGPGSRIRRKCEKIQKKHSTWCLKLIHFSVKIWVLSLCVFFGFWMSLDEFLFCGLVTKVLQTVTTWGHSCSYILHQSWKAENSYFAQTKHYFFEFWGAGSEHLGQLFPTFFLVWILGHDFTILLKKWGSSRSSKDDFLWLFWGHIT